jgi:putative transcriptional regulator
MLMDEVEEILEDAGFNYCECRGCFDIAARRKSILLLKVLANVDSFQEDQADNLKILSGSLSARTMVVGLCTRREELSDNIIYERFDIPTVSPGTLESMLHGGLPGIYRFRGGVFAEIDPLKLRKAREDVGLSQSELAKKVGVTKKSIYEHESEKMKMVYDNAVKLEKVLKVRIIAPLEVKASYFVESSPRTVFESKVSRNFVNMGFETDSVYRSPFNMIARGPFHILSDVEENEKMIERNVPYIAEFSRLTEKSAVIVTKSEVNFNVPSIKEADLVGMDANGLKRFVKKW